MAYSRSMMPSTLVRSTPLRNPPKDGQTTRVFQATGQPSWSNAAGELGVRRRAIQIVLHIVLARPGELHGLADGLGDLDRFADVIVCRRGGQIRRPGTWCGSGSCPEEVR